nr:amidohydrolase [Synergistaceae bacterium]
MSVVLKNSMLGAELLSSAEAMTDQLAEWRRSFHQFPELAFEEHVTVSNLSRILSEIRGIEVIRGFGVPPSVIGVIGQGLPGPAVAIRAEMDAMSM